MQSRWVLINKVINSNYLFFLPSLCGSLIQPRPTIIYIVGVQFSQPSLILGKTELLPEDHSALRPWPVIFKCVPPLHRELCVREIYQI